MVEYLKKWLIDIHTNHGVNPIIFAILYFIGVVPFWFSIYKIIVCLKNKNLNQVMTFGIILGIIIILPFIYVALFGHNLPFWFWIIATCITGYSSYSVVRRIKSVSKKP